MAVQQLEDLTGEEVDVEEGAIATAFKKLATEELELLYPLKALAEAQQLPIRPLLEEYQKTLQGILTSASDDCIRILSETGAIFKESQERVRVLRETLTDQSLAVLRQARTVVQQLWPRLAPRNPDAMLVQCAQRLATTLASDQCIEYYDAIATDTKTLVDAYRSVYLGLFTSRKDAFEKAIEEVKNRPEFEPLVKTKNDVADSLLAALQVRVGTDDERLAVANGTSLGNASLTEMESDLAAVDGLKATALVKLQELTMGGEKNVPVRRVRVNEFFNRPIQNQDDLEAALQQLRDSLQKIIDEGAAIILE